MIKSILKITKPIRYWIESKLYSEEELKKIETLKGYADNKTVIVVGNGPSLNKTPLEKFTNCTSIGMNKIDLLFSRVSWRPDFIVAENNLVVKQHWKTMKNHGIRCLLSWKTRWFIPSKERDQFYFYLSLPSKSFSKDIKNGFGTSSTVTYSALQLAYCMGAKNVILFGVDHSFASKGKPLTYELREGPDSNHFDPNYFKSGAYWGVPDLDDSELGYMIAKEAFENDGRKIYDATIDGKLNIFEKISLSEALEMVKND